MDSDDFSKQNMLLWWPVAWGRSLLTRSNNYLLLWNETVVLRVYGLVHRDAFVNLPKIKWISWQWTFSAYMQDMQDVDIFFFTLPIDVALHTDTSCPCVCVHEWMLTILTDKTEIAFSPQSLSNVCTRLISSMKTSGKRQFEDLLSLHLAYMPKCMCTRMCSQCDDV